MVFLCRKGDYCVYGTISVCRDNIPIISIVIPIYSDTNKELFGIAGIDISLDNVAETMSAHTIGKSGFAVLLSAKGTVAYAPTKKIILLNMANLSVNEEAIKAVKMQKVLSK